MVESGNGLTDCRKGLAVVFLFFVSFLRDMLLSRLDAAGLRRRFTWQTPAEVAVQMGAKDTPFFNNRNVFWLLQWREC